MKSIKNKNHFNRNMFSLPISDRSQTNDLVPMNDEKLKIINAFEKMSVKKKNESLPLIDHKKHIAKTLSLKGKQNKGLNYNDVGVENLDERLETEDNNMDNL